MTNTGTLTSGRLIKGNGGVDITVGDLTGDITTSGGLGTTLATSGVTAGVYGSATTSAAITVDAKGRVTAATDTPITGAGDWVRLAQIVTSSSQATVDFDSISGAYSTLKLIGASADTQSGTSIVGVLVKVNNDGTASNYTSSGRIFVNNAATLITEVAAGTSGVFMGTHPQAGTSGAATTWELTIAGYSGTTFHKQLLCTFGNTTTTNNTYAGTVSARWKSTAAITRLTLSTNGTAFQDGSTFTLYGLR